MGPLDSRNTNSHRILAKESAVNYELSYSPSHHSATFKTFKIQTPVEVSRPSNIQPLQTQFKNPTLLNFPYPCSPLSSPLSYPCVLSLSLSKDKTLSLFTTILFLSLSLSQKSPYLYLSVCLFVCLTLSKDKQPPRRAKRTTKKTWALWWGM